jgi:asparagine synthase (glutamine-hydrolysing)
MLASKFGKVVLSGTGGDETVAGYPWRYYRAVVNRDFDHYVEKYASYWQRLLRPEERRAVLAPVWSAVDALDPRAIVRGVFGERAGRPATPAEYVNHSLYFEARTFLHGLLVVEDKLSMAHGLETRVPFLDNDLVDFAMRVSVGHKLGRLLEVVAAGELEPGPRTQAFFHAPSDGKLVLRRAMEHFVPREIAQRHKQGFSAPDASWFRGESIDYVRRRLLRGETPLWDVLDRDAVRRLVTDHLEGRENRRLLVWSLLSLDEWCRTFLAGESPAAAPVAAQTG